MDQFQRATYLLNQFNMVNINAGLVTVQDIMRSSADLNCILLFRLLKNDPFLLVSEEYFISETAASHEIEVLISDFRQNRITAYETQERLGHLNNLLLDLESNMRNYSMRLSEGRVLFENICHRLELFVSQILALRMHGSEYYVPIEDENPINNFTVVSIDHLQDVFVNYDMSVCDPLNEINLIQEMLSTNANTFKKIFRYYVIQPQRHRQQVSNTMDSQTFMKFIHESKIPSPKLKLGEIDEIFWLVNRQSELKSKSTPDNGADAPLEEEKEIEENATNPDQELIPSEFIETLIRIADRKFSDAILSQRFEQLLNLHVFKFAAQVDGLSFRKELSSEDVNEVFRKNQRALKLVFSHYASHGTKIVYVTYAF